MDTRRLLIACAMTLLAGGCAAAGNRIPAPVEIAPPVASAPVVAEAAVIEAPAEVEVGIEAGVEAETSTARPWRASSAAPVGRPAVAGEGATAVAAANLAARTRSEADRFVGGAQVFERRPGRVYEVWTAPLRVTTLTLAPGETLLSKAAGDTLRWQVGEARSGEGATARVHVLLKPLERGLATNLVLTTSRGLYQVSLRSGGPASFNSEVAWEDDGVLSPEEASAAEIANAADQSAGEAAPETFNARYRIDGGRRPPSWAPTAVFDDGRRTFLVLPVSARTGSAPALFALAADGGRQMTGYRQANGMLVMDGLLDRAELRMEGQARGVKVERLAEDRP